MEVAKRCKKKLPTRLKVQAQLCHLYYISQLNSTMLAAVTFGVESGGWVLALIDRRKWNWTECASIVRGSQSFRYSKLTTRNKIITKTGVAATCDFADVSIRTVMQEFTVAKKLQPLFCVLLRYNFVLTWPNTDWSVLGHVIYDSAVEIEVNRRGRAGKGKLKPSVAFLSPSSGSVSLFQLFYPFCFVIDAPPHTHTHTVFITMLSSKYRIANFVFLKISFEHENKT